MNFKANSFKELNLQKKIKKNQGTIGLPLPKETQTSLPIRKRQYQLFSSSQVEPNYHPNFFKFSQTNSVVHERLSNPNHIRYASQKGGIFFAEMKENHSTNKPVLKIEKTDQTHKYSKGSMTPNNKRYPQTNNFQWKFQRKHRKELSSELQESNMNEVFENRCKTATNESIHNTFGLDQTEGLGSFKSLFSKGVAQSLFDSQINHHREQGALKLTRLKCSNNDGKIAKYKIVNSESQAADLLYCPRCTIALVHQGFVLEELDFIKEKASKQSKLKWINELQQTKRSASKVVDLLRSRQQLDRNTISTYYQQLRKCIQQCQEEDIQLVYQYYSQKQSQIANKIEEINRILTSLDKQNKQQLPSLQISDLKQLLQKHQARKDNNVKINEEMIEIFSSIFEEQFRPNLESYHDSAKDTKKEKQSVSTNLLQSVSMNNALRFSFEKMIDDNTCKKKKIQSLANLQGPDKQTQIDKVNANSCESPAFRNLFPRDEDSEQISTDVSSPTFKNI